MDTGTQERTSFLSWHVQMPLLTNRFFLYDMVKLFFWTGLILFAILSCISIASGHPGQIPGIAAVGCIILGGIAFLFVLISLVFFGNRWPMAFLVAPAGISYESQSRRGKIANRVAIVAGALTGNPGAVGAGLLAASREEGMLLWREIRRIKANPDLRSISVMNSWRVVVRLYCTPENFTEVVNLVQQYSGLAIQFTPAKQLPQVARAPIGIREIFRRIALLACVGVALWQAFVSPPVLIKASRADFAAEYKRQFAPPDEPPLGVVERGRELIRRLREPMTLDQFVASATERHLIESKSAEWLAFYSSLPADGKWMSLDDPALAEVRDAIQDKFKQTQWSAMYIPVRGAAGTGYIEFDYQTRPRGGKAPASLIYPMRARSWWWLLAGIALYAVFPWARPSAWMAHYDRVAVMALDLIGILVAAFFFALPLYASNSTQDVLTTDFGLTVFLWCIAFIGVLFLLWAARLASWCVLVEQGQLRVGRMTGMKTFTFAEVANARFTTRDGARSGVLLQCRGGHGALLPWDGVVGFEKVLQGLQLGGIVVAGDIQ